MLRKVVNRSECDNGTNSAVTCIRVGLSVAAAQVEDAAVAPVDEEAISGRELAAGPVPATILACEVSHEPWLFACIGI